MFFSKLSENSFNFHQVFFAEELADKALFDFFGYLSDLGLVFFGQFYSSNTVFFERFLEGDFILSSAEDLEFSVVFFGGIEENLLEIWRQAVELLLGQDGRPDSDGEAVFNPVLNVGMPLEG